MDDRITIREFVNKYSITMTAKRAPSNPHLHENKPRPGMRKIEYDHWQCELRIPYKSAKSDDFIVRLWQTFEVYFSQGEGHRRDPWATVPSMTAKPPKVEDVLSCLASDIASIRNARDMFEWMEELGFELSDGRWAMQSWEHIHQQEKELREFLGAAELEELLWETEPL